MGVKPSEALAPDCIAYFPMDLRMPASMQPAKDYWFHRSRVARAAASVGIVQTPFPVLFERRMAGRSRALAGRGIQEPCEIQGDHARSPAALA